uniref:Uncharacterized protein n=2 Tax=viral metagenome TaxID=1070528 RepID=A0A6M3ISK6_9ZZZZ
MAKITERKAIVQKEEVVGYTLEISVDEAEALRAVSGSVGGSPTCSRRGDVDSVYECLCRGGVSNKATKELTGRLDFSTRRD